MLGGFLPCLVVILAAVSHASCHTQSLSQGASGHVDVVLTLKEQTERGKGKLTNDSKLVAARGIQEKTYRSGVTLQDGIHLSQSEEMLLREQAHLTQGSIQDGAGVSLYARVTGM